ncbi:hypothetical protein J8281_04685 [Aquimarina sp. U1-2]|uniref:hypothetical protein n=1 Tax=Aquimarina sp. U1-2 TaxID=2823141 RepID=UPI001AECC8A9|nr:hypothetical protein [Aquimarina sp. U1-2]MBP2831476.1 hypothetical protein [Aquimarina sp. U1-2]
MNASKNEGIKIYQNLGKLFYAIAASDRVVREAEYNMLRKIVQTKWLNASKVEDKFGPDAAYQIEIVFDWMDAEESSAETCFSSFEQCYLNYKSKFTTQIRQLIWDTADAIASAFSDKNKSELIMLGRLRLLFEK